MFVLYACNCLALKLHSNHCQQVLMFSEVHPFMVQKAFETNLKHDAKSVLSPPSCVHFWLNIAECFMFQRSYANNLAPERCMISLLGLRSQSLHSPVHGVAQFLHKWTAETCTRASNKKKSPGLGETYVLHLGTALYFLSVSLQQASRV